MNINISPDIKYITIPIGTILYRAANKVCVYTPGHIKCTSRECSNTGKKGLFFGNYLLLALAMSTEYNRNMELGVFVTTKELKVMKGKYAYKKLHPERYRTGAYPASLLPDENVSHFNNQILPIFIQDTIKSEREFNEFENEGELFVESRLLSHIKLVAAYKLNVEQLRESVASMKDYEIPRYDINFYLREGVLTYFNCNTSKKTNRNETRRKK